VYRMKIIKGTSYDEIEQRINDFLNNPMIKRVVKVDVKRENSMLVANILLEVIQTEKIVDDLGGGKQITYDIFDE
jgi:hypothetical protein